MFNQYLISLFLILPLFIYLYKERKLAPYGIGLFGSTPSRREGLIEVSLLIILPSLFFFFSFFNFSKDRLVFFTSSVFIFHLLFIATQVFQSLKNKNQSINFGILTFLSVLALSKSQSVVLIGLTCLIVIFNRGKKPTSLVEFYFIAYEALFLSYFLCVDVLEINSWIILSFFSGLFAILLVVSAKNRLIDFFAQLAKLSTLLFIIYLLYLSLLKQWSYWL